MPFPTVVPVSILGVLVGAYVLLRLAGGSMPWGQLLIAVGPDGRPMRPRVRWHLWSISRGESPRLAALAGFASTALGLVSLAAVGPPLIDSMFRPLNPGITWLLVSCSAAACVVTPMGLAVLIRATLDVLAPKASMMGSVVGTRRDLGIFGHTYHIAVQGGDRGLARGLWAESFRVDRQVFKSLHPGDRVTIRYSPHLRYVYQAEPR